MGGHQPPGPVCGHKLGTQWIDNGTSCRARTSSPHSVGHPSAAEVKRRKLATTLHAQNARDLLKAQLPVVLDNMSDEQIRQMQMVLDASVIDPAIEKEAKKYYTKAGVWTSQGYAIWDEGAKRKADRIMDGFIRVADWDSRIRLDYQKLMESNALKPATDNPDEATFFDSIKKTLDKRGVWLQYGAQLVRDPDDPSSHIVDPRTFSVWITLGQDGDKIPTKNGKLTRDALLETSELGLEYYMRVHLGPVQKALEREMARLDNQISTGQSQHISLRQERSHSPIVATISDVLGGADFPDYSIWDPPFRMLLRAREMNIRGNISASRALVITAAILARTNAQVLADYVDKTTTGAGRAVTILKVAKVCGEIAGIVLMVTGVVAAARVGLAAAAEGGAGTASEVDVLAKKVVDKAIADNPELASDLGNVRWVRGPKGQIGGFVKGGHSSGLSGGGWQNWP
jgi:hypothetical protein